MAYRSSVFGDVVSGVMRLAGIGTTASADADAQAQAVEFINERLREAWEQEFWAELCPAEQRYYRPAWSSDVTYTAGDEVFFTNEDGSVCGYFSANASPQSLADGSTIDAIDAAEDKEITYTYLDASSPVDNRIETRVVESISLGLTYTETYAYGGSTGNYYVTSITRTVALNQGQSPATHPDNWTALSILRRTVGLDQEGLTPIGEVYGVFDRDPVTYPDTARRLAFALTDEGIVPRSYGGLTVWVRFRLRPLRFTLTPWDGATAYAAGDIVYSASTRECYQANTASTGVAVTNTTAWKKQLFPYVLETFVKRAAAADMLPADGETDAAGPALSRAYKALNDASDTATLSQSQVDRTQIRTY